MDNVQIAPALVAIALGLAIGYLIKHLLAAHAMRQTEMMWGEKVRRTTREMDTLRSDLKTAVERADIATETEHSAKAKANDLEAEMRSQREKIAALEADVAAKAEQLGDWALRPAPKKAELDPEGLNPADLAAELHEKERTLSEQEVELTQLKQTVVAQEFSIKTLGARMAELEPLAAKLASANQGRKDLETRLRAFETAKTRELGTLHTKLSDLEPLAAKAKDWEQRYQEMLRTKDSSIARLTSRLAELEALEGKVGSWPKERARFEAAIEQLESERKKLFEESEERLSVWDRRFQAAILEKDSEILELRGNGLASGSAANAPDDLKEISGVGKVLEGRLHECGVLSFKRMALWTADDIREFESRFPQVKKRYDHWIEAAKEAHFKKYGERL